MEEKILFEEEQQFRQWWLWALMAVVLLFILSAVFNLRETERPPGIIGLITILFVVLLFWFEKLKTRITTKGIYYSFTLLPFTSRFKEWGEIERAYVRNYNAMWEYGGWGLRWWLSGWAYNVSGNMGLQLELKDGRKLLIGTQKPEELQAVINSLLNK